MIQTVTIKDNSRTPVRYLSSLPSFDNGRTFTFKGGVNIIVGGNGSGKTTLLRLIQSYILLDNGGQSTKNIRSLFSFGGQFLDGVDVESDYQVASFKMNHQSEMTEDEKQNDVLALAQTMECASASTGEGVVVAMNVLFKKLFSKGVNLNFPAKEVVARKDDERFGKYVDYIKRNATPVTYDDWEVTVFMDEPDRNLDILNIDQVLGVLREKKEHTQLIAVVHNPLLIYSLAKTGANIIEMEEGYVKKVMNKIDKLVR